MNVLKEVKKRPISFLDYSYSITNQIPPCGRDDKQRVYELLPPCPQKGNGPVVIPHFKHQRNPYTIRVISDS